VIPSFSEGRGRAAAEQSLSLRQFRINARYAHTGACFIPLGRELHDDDAMAEPIGDDPSAEFKKAYW